MITSPRKCAVLIVEDEAILRMHAIDIVEDAGFVAIEAKTADEAIAILESRSDIAMLFTDINMPGSMNGLKLAHAVRQKWPPIKIVVISGHVELDESDLPSNSVYWGKPLQAQQMVAQLKELIS